MSSNQEEASLADSLAKDAEEMFDFLKSKGPVVEGFRREYDQLRQTLESLQESVLVKERESESLTIELTQVRDQLTNSRRAIDEANIQRENLQGTIDYIQASRQTLVEKEVSNRTEITHYSGKFDELKKALALGSGWTAEQEDEKISLEKNRDFLVKKLENKTNLVNGVRSDVDKLYEMTQQVEQEVAEVDSKIEFMNNEIKTHNKKARAQKETSEALETRIRELQQSIVSAEKDLADRNRIQQGEDKTLGDLENSLTVSRQRMEEYLREYDALVRTTVDLTSELERIQATNSKITEELNEREQYIANKGKEMEELMKETAKVSGLKDLALKKLEEAEKEKHELDVKKEMLQKKIETTREVDLMAVRKQCEAYSRQQSSLQKEIDILKKKFDGSERSAKTIEDLMYLNNNQRRNLSSEKKVLMDQVQAQQEQIQLLLQEKEKHEAEAESTNQQYYTALEELKLQELQIKELQRKIAEDQAKLKQKQNLYEAVRSDRNLYSKQLVESQEEIGTLKRKFRLLNYQIEQLKEEINAKDNCIVKEHFHHHTVDKEREMLRNELTKVRKQVNSSEQIIENQQVEVLKLTRIIEEADRERQRQTNELQAVIAERNLLTAQLVKRDYEISGMYERIKVQRSNLRIGERHFDRVRAALQQWRRQVVALVEDQKSTMNELSVLEDLKGAVFKMEREVLTEKSKTRALMDELSRPMNVHRWRVLESADPKRFELIRQIQSMQRQLIQKSDEVTRLELLIQEKERVYVELKNIIARQPGPEVEEQILVYQQTLKDKTKQLSAMNEELEMFRMQVDCFKDEIDALDKDMGSVKKKWMKSKRMQETS